MAASKDITDFVRDALAGGRSRAEIDAALIAAGWSRHDTDEALASFSDGSFLPPVPRPRRYLASRDAFICALMFIMLGLTAGHLISLVFAVIDLWLPDMRTSYYSFRYAESQIRWGIAVLVLATPLYLWLMHLSDHRIEGETGPRRSVLRKWLTYIALLASAMSLLGDAAYVIYRLLSGDATLEFILKSLTVALVAVAIFAFYLRDVEWGRDRVQTRGFGLGVAIAVMLALATALWTIGGPGQARFDQGDTLRYQALTRIVSVLQCNSRSLNARVPEPPEELTIETLLEHCPGHARLPVDVLLDPVSENPYSYRRVGTFGFQLCAEFHNARLAYNRFTWAFPFDPATGCMSGHSG